MTFAELPEGIAGELEALAPLRLRVNQNTIEVALKTEETHVLEVVTALAKRGHVLRVEISGASLEDIFVELMQKS